MIEYEDPDFRASKYPPNPLEITYWIDLSKDTSGNVIRSYNPVEKRWIPLNRDYNKDQWNHITELVETLGFDWDKHNDGVILADHDKVELPDFSDNNYFKDGKNLTLIIHNGDVAIKAEVDRLDKRIDDEIARAKAEEARLDKKIDAETTRATAAEAKLQQNITNEANSRTTIDTQHDSKMASLETQLSNLQRRIQTLETNYNSLTNGL